MSNKVVNSLSLAVGAALLGTVFAAGAARTRRARKAPAAATSTESRFRSTETSQAVSREFVVQGGGLGLRRALLGPLEAMPRESVDFMEVAPENWIGVGGPLGRRFRGFTERYPFVCHGLSLSLGGPSPLDETFLRKVRRFLDQHQIRLYSEHLSYCADEAHLYDLMPIPFTEDAVRHVAARVRRTQDLVGRRMAIENVSYYTPVGAEMS